MAAKLIVFSELVETGGKFDLKNGSFSPEELGNVKYAYYNNVLYYYEEFGNYNYGFAANSFDIPLSLALEGAGFNEVYKYLRKKDGCPNFTNYIGFFDNYDATKSIIRGYLLLPMNYQFPNIP